MTDPRRVAAVFVAALALSGCGDNGGGAVAGGPDVTEDVTAPATGPFTWQRVAADMPAQTQFMRGRGEFLVLAEPEVDCCLRIWTWTPSTGVAAIDLTDDVAFIPFSSDVDGDRLAISGVTVETSGAERAVVAIGPVDGPLDVSALASAPVGEVVSWSGFASLHLNADGIVGLATGRAAGSADPNGEPILFRGRLDPFGVAWEFETLDRAQFAGPDDRLSLHEGALIAANLGSSASSTSRWHVTADGLEFRELAPAAGATEAYVVGGADDDYVLATYDATGATALWVDRGTGAAEPIDLPTTDPIHRATIGDAGLLVVTDNGSGGSDVHDLHWKEPTGDWVSSQLDRADLEAQPGWGLSINDVVAVGEGFVLQVVHNPPPDPNAAEGADEDRRLWELWYLIP